MSMFCFQCQEAAKGTGCTVIGACGKTDEVSRLQDLLVYTVKGVAVLSSESRKKGKPTAESDIYLLDSLFTTITNANFDKEAIIEKIRHGLKLQEDLKKNLGNFDSKFSNHDIINRKDSTESQMIQKSLTIGILEMNPDLDVRSLRELLVYGVKGIAAYAQHAKVLGYESSEIFSFIEKALLATLNDDLTTNELVALVLECGKFGVDTMALLDKANTTTYGNPEITKVNIGVRHNPGILISGHDLKDIEQLLAQTDGTGVDVYTHSEMLPAHYYPAFKKYNHFAGNYGGSWWQQTSDFESFNGPVLFTTNCIVPPKKDAGYKDRIYTTGSAGHPGFIHIHEDKNGKKDFSTIIEHAKKTAPPKEIESGEIIGGFAHNQVALLADKVVDAVKTGAVKKFVVMAGCDGRQAKRGYYTDFAGGLPKDTIILTAGCAKYRYNKLQLGDIGGIPRVLDAGQCNDSYSLAVTALKLKEAFGLKDINDLPIAYNIAWYEQKAVIVLLALLYLGVKKIKLGPTLPAFLSPNVAKVLVETFGISGIDSVEKDMKEFSIS